MGFTSNAASFGSTLQTNSNTFSFFFFSATELDELANKDVERDEIEDY